MRNLTIQVVACFGFIFSFVVPNLTYADHLTTRLGEERKIFHGKNDPVLNDPVLNEQKPIETGWGVTLRGGSSFFTEDLEESNVGLLINGQLFYNIGGHWHWGINFDWERHGSLKGTAVNFETISLIPYWEFHTNYNRWSPYVTLGVGINLNSFRNESAGIDLDAKNTVAFKGGVGTDFFLTKNLALNLESAWKLNEDGDTNLKASVVQVLFGFRWYFD